jgi:hypothetical protein
MKENTMTKEEYFKLSLSEGYLNVLAWYYEVFSIQLPGSRYKYVQIVDDHFETIDGMPIDGDVSGPLLSPDLVIVLNAGDIANVTETTATTIGKAIVNYTILANSFGTKINYDNGD